MRCRAIRAWPTQPIPLKPPSLARNSFKREELATVTPELNKFCTELFDSIPGGLHVNGAVHALLHYAERDFSQLHRRRQLEPSVIRSIVRLSVRQHHGFRQPQHDGEERGWDSL